MLDFMICLWCNYLDSQDNKFSLSVKIKIKYFMILVDNQVWLGDAGRQYRGVTCDASAVSLIM